MMSGKCSKLATETCRRLQQREISIEDFCLFLVTMCFSCYYKDGDDMVATNTESAKSLDEIFCVLSKNSFWDYYPLQNTIEHFARSDFKLRVWMEQYKRDLSGHCLAVKIHVHGCHELLRIHQAFPTPANIAHHTLSYIKDLWHSLECWFSLPPLETILHGTRILKHVRQRAHSEPTNCGQ